MKRNDLIPYSAIEDGAMQAGDNSHAGHKIDQCILYMRQHLDQPLQVNRLAAIARVSTSHFFALFKRRTGCPPIDYFTRLRMEHARQLLGASTASVKEVAAALGYDDAFYFSRVFKLTNRVAPSQYRALQQETIEARKPAN